MWPFSDTALNDEPPLISAAVQSIARVALPLLGSSRLERVPVLVALHGYKSEDHHLIEICIKATTNSGIRLQQNPFCT